MMVMMMYYIGRYVYIYIYIYIYSYYSMSCNYNMKETKYNKRELLNTIQFDTLHVIPFLS